MNNFTRDGYRIGNVSRVLEELLGERDPSACQLLRRQGRTTSRIIVIIGISISIIGAIESLAIAIVGSGRRTDALHLGFHRGSCRLAAVEYPAIDLAESATASTRSSGHDRSVPSIRCRWHQRHHQPDSDSDIALAVRRRPPSIIASSQSILAKHDHPVIGSRRIGSR